MKTYALAVCLSIFCLFINNACTPGSRGEDDVINGNVPAGVNQFLQQQFSSFQIADSHWEDVCDRPMWLEVEVEGAGRSSRIKYYFDKNGNALFSVVRYEDGSALSSQVKTHLSTNYSGYGIDRVDELTPIETGQKQYVIRLRASSGSGKKRELLIEANGNVLLACS